MTHKNTKTLDPDQSGSETLLFWLDNIFTCSTRFSGEKHYLSLSLRLRYQSSPGPQKIKIVRKIRTIKHKTPASQKNSSGKTNGGSNFSEKFCWERRVVQFFFVTCRDP
jgi:hypothetical protein